MNAITRQPIFRQDGIYDPASGEILPPRSAPAISAAYSGWPPASAPIAEFALFYARLGWHVFPCGRKAPLTACDKDANGQKIPGTGGFYKATTDENQIRAWWRKFPSAMIGVRAGEASGVFAIDPDGEEGLANWAAIVAKQGAVPATHMHRTPGGGQHLIFKWSADRPVNCSPGQMKGLKIDVKGQGGYFIAPPSMGKNGKRYEIADPARFFEFAEAPRWLYELLTKPEASIREQAMAGGRPRDGFDDFSDSRTAGTNLPYIDAMVRGICDGLSRISPGAGRNAELNDAATRLGHYVASGELDERRVFDELLNACAANGVLSDDGRSQCLATIRSGLRKGKQEPLYAPERRTADVVQHPGAKAPEDPESTPRPPLRWLNMSEWDDQPVPEREWIIRDRVPIRQVGLFSGEGGTGKSIIELMRNVAHVTGKDWLGSLPEQGPAFYLGAEDAADEIHIRLAAIAGHYGVTFKDLTDGGLQVLPLLGQDATLCAPSRSGRIEVTGLYNQLYEAAGDIKPKNISIDTLSRAFAGNEIDRVQVYAFAMHMQAIAEVANGSVTILSHPSLAGINSGSGISGSTAWHGAFRFRFYLKSTKTEGGEQPDNDLREIEFKKNQYGPKSESMVLRYQRGLFLPEAGLSGLDKMARRSKAEEVFMDLLRRFAGQGRNVSDKANANNFAPAVFAKEDEAKKYQLKKLELEEAMRGLFRADRIVLESYDKPSRGYWRLAAKGG